MTRKSAGNRNDHSSSTRRIPGAASASGTRRFADRFAGTFAPDFYRAAPAGLSLSSIGMGTYLGECDDGEDQRYVDVLTAGVSSGLNVLDTAINYRCQRSERAVGRALRKIFDEHIAQRDEIVVCTKGGYVPLEESPPESRSDYDAYLDREYFSASVMSKDDIVAGGHCITPRFLADQSGAETTWALKASMSSICTTPSSSSTHSIATGSPAALPMHSRSSSRRPEPVTSARTGARHGMGSALLQLHATTSRSHTCFKSPPRSAGNPTTSGSCSSR